MPVTGHRKRPVYLNLFKIRQPIGAITSIVHRLTGIVLVAVLAPALSLLARSLASPEGFAEVTAWLAGSVGKAVALLAAWLFAQHLFSGIRLMLIDLDIGARLPAARAMAWGSFAAAVVTVAGLWWVW